jgi:hypothetical protein
VFEAVEASFDAVALFVELAVVGSGLFPVPSWWDNGDRAQAMHLSYDLSRVVALVCDHGLGLLTFEQKDGLGIFSGLSSRDAEVHRQTVFIGQQMDLGAQTSSGTPQSLVFRAPFLRPAAAC